MVDFSPKQDGESQWLPISDLMAVLMMVFLLIAVSFMLRVYMEKERIREVAVTYNKLQDDLYEELLTEFQDDLERWDAVIDKENLSVRFKSPRIIFDNNEYEINKDFKDILDEFFPRFIRILHGDEYRNDIDEIRIEGHTSSEWRTQTSEHDAYILNMQLSQNRTRNVLEYVLGIDDNHTILRWARQHLVANGLSSSRLIYNADGTENKELSKRVEFRVKTNAEQRIAKILSE